MNYIKLLAGFFEKVADDDRLNPTHISMYVSIFQLWNANRFKNPISISRNLVMKVCKISSNATYHKCIKELHEYGYLKYAPSYNPYKGSLVFLFDFYPLEVEEAVADFAENKLPLATSKTTNNLTINQTGDDNEIAVIHTKNQTGGYQQLALFCHTKIETSSVQALVPYINIPNIINKEDKNKEKNEIPKPCFSKKNKSGMKKEKEKNCAKKDKENNSNKAPLGVGVGVWVIPTLDTVLEYFILKKYAPIEAEKFFNYFQSNGWLVGGKSKMKDWNAAARNWILNSKNFNQPKTVIHSIPNNLQSLKNKNYNEPL